MSTTECASSSNSLSMVQPIFVQLGSRYPYSGVDVCTILRYVFLVADVVSD